MSRITTDYPPPSLLLTSHPLQSLKGLKQRWSAFPRRLTTRPVVAQVTAHMSLICGAPGAVVVERGGVLKKKGGGREKAVVNENRKLWEAELEMTSVVRGRWETHNRLHGYTTAHMLSVSDHTVSQEHNRVL